MRKLFVFFLFVHFVSFSQQAYKVEIDLKKVSSKGIKVRVQLPDSLSIEDVFCFPAIIPGTYARYDFGRVVTKFRAEDSRGKKVSFKRENTNTFSFKKNKQVKYLEYWVKDTWPEKKSTNYIFQPAGTYFNEGKVYVLNFSGIVGYVQSKSKLPFELKISYPENLFGSTSVTTKTITKGNDTYLIKDYNELIDSPMLYCKADTTSFYAGDSKIGFSIFSENDIVNAQVVANSMKPLTFSLKDFFGKLPVKNYQFLYYFSDPSNKKTRGDGGLGALEHNYSSFYFLIEQKDTTSIKHMVRDVSSHEFFHILTPLNIHSEEIQNFDFQSPKMSKHLWMYEGITEYFAHLVQEKGGLITQKRFMEIIRSKMIEADNYPNHSFTEMSSKILQDEFKPSYANVYEKGAVIAFLLDIKLNELSEGKKNLKDLMLELSALYGPNKSFADSALFDIIAEHSYPAIKSFLMDYVQGIKELPYQEYFQKIGYTFIKEEKDTVSGLGKNNLYYEPSADGIYVYGVDQVNNPLSLKTNDVIVSLNGIKITEQNAIEKLEELTKPNAGKLYEIELLRDKKSIKSSGTTVLYERTRKNVIKEIENINESQIKFREWMLE
jgi:predicted metalloprotease with PDZ domain